MKRACSSEVSKRNPSRSTSHGRGLGTSDRFPADNHSAPQPSALSSLWTQPWRSRVECDRDPGVGELHIFDMNEVAENLKRLITCVPACVLSRLLWQAGYPLG